MPLAVDCPYLAPASASDSPVESFKRVCNGLCFSFLGGKAFGLLKAQQRDRLEEINKVKSKHSICIIVLHVVLCARRVYFGGLELPASVLVV